MKKHLITKLRESVTSVLPVAAIVFILNFTISPMPFLIMVRFSIGTILLIAGMTLFNLGAEISMMSMGEKIGSYLIRTRKLGFIIIATFIMGVFITIAEPDLKVLARQLPEIPDIILIVTVAVGVGLFLVLSFLRIFFQIKFSFLIIGLYALVFLLAAFTQKNFLAVSFDSGGVATGPIMVPFIMALGLGLASARSDKSTKEDSFGLTALILIGPIITVLIMGIFYRIPSDSYSSQAIAEADSILQVFESFLLHAPEFIKEVAVAILPILVIFILFQVFAIHLKKRALLKILVGLLYTFIGLVLFLISVNVGFMPAGNRLGSTIAGSRYKWSLIPIGTLIGYFIVAAEPAVHVLKQQVEDITDGAISGRSLALCLSIGIALSVGLSMLRVITGLSLWYFILPGYGIALILSLFVPPIFTSIAFDSGAVASGPMTATFLLSFAMGASEAVGGNILTDAFGIVAMVAMAPPVTIQCLGVIYRIRSRKAALMETEPAASDMILELPDELHHHNSIDG